MYAYFFVFLTVELQILCILYKISISACLDWVGVEAKMLHVAVLEVTRAMVYITLQYIGAQNLTWRNQ